MGKLKRYKAFDNANVFEILLLSAMIVAPIIAILTRL